jgi:hypothetical protein
MAGRDVLGWRLPDEQRRYYGGDEQRGGYVEPGYPPPARRRLRDLADPDLGAAWCQGGWGQVLRGLQE